MADAFVYCWSNIESGRKYIGYHKGATDDGYISSSKSNEFWIDFDAGRLSRHIIAKGTVEDCIKFESALLSACGITHKKSTTEFYNANLNGKIIFTDEVRSKMREAWIDRKANGQGQPGLGKILTEEHKQKLKDSKAKMSPEKKREIARAAGLKSAEARRNGTTKIPYDNSAAVKAGWVKRKAGK